MMQPTLSILFSLALALFTHFLYRLYKARRWFNGLPQPPHSFFWGHLKLMGEIASTMPPNMHPQAYITAIAQKYNLKGIFYLDLWPVADSQVVLLDPNLMHQMQVINSLPMHTMADDFLAPIVGRNGIATSNGSVWKKQHNAMVPAFSWSHIRNLTGVMTEEVMHFRNTLDGLAQTGEAFSMEETAARLIFDVIARITFNFPLHAQTQKSSYFDDLRKLIRLAEAQFSWNPFVKFAAFFRRKVILARLHPSMESKIKERLGLLRQERIIPSRRDPFSILDLMLRERLQEEILKVETKNTVELTQEYHKSLLTNIKGLLVGGHGTTTDTLCFIYMLLSKSPEVVLRLKEEHSKVFHKDFAETQNILRDSPEKLNELEFTAAVIKETLRLFPVGFSVREAADGATLTYEGQTYPIDNHVAVIASAHTLHYDPNCYSDPAKFNPDRFMDMDNIVPSVNFRTFGRGPRACLGQNLATNELKVILLMTLRDYNIQCADLKPNELPRTNFTALDTVFGDVIFQELALEARPRGPVMMTVTKCV